MELQLKQQVLSVQALALDCSLEQSVEGDVLLPDYCPDIQRVLCCQLRCLPGESRAEGQRLSISGELRATVLYLSESGALRGVDYKQPFQRQVESRLPLRDPLVQLSCRVSYLNCRAVSSRRLELRGAVTLNLRAVSGGREQLLSEGSGNGLQLRRQDLERDCCLCWGENSLSVKEELDLAGRPPVGQLLWSQAQARLTDQKLLPGKLLCKVELCVSLLYQPLSKEEDTAPQQLSYNIPLSLIVPVEGSQEDCGCSVELELCGWDLQPRSDANGEQTILAVEAQVRAKALVHGPCQLSLVRDAYSTRCAAKLEEKELSFLSFVRPVQETQRLRENLSCSGSPKALLAQWCQPGELRCASGSQGLQLTGSVELFALVQLEEGGLELCQKTLPIEQSLPQEGEGQFLLLMPRLCCNDLEGRLSGGSVELRGSVELSGCLYSLELCRAVADLSLDESQPKQRARDWALGVYYADQGESVWDIGKSYNTSVQAIMDENGLDQDCLPQRTMLLIPMV